MDSATWAINFSNQTRLESLIVLGMAVVTVLIINLFFGLATPFSHLFTFIHELGHTLAALMARGEVKGIKVHLTPQDGAYGWADIPKHGNSYLVIPSGYLAPTIFSAGLILLAAWPYLAPFILSIVALMLVISTFHFGLSIFTRLLGLGFAVLFIWVALQAELFWSIFLLFLVAIEGSFVALADLAELGRIVRQNPQGGGDDASRMAALFSERSSLRAPIFWVRLWTLLSIVLLILAIWFTWFRGMTA